LNSSLRRRRRRSRPPTAKELVLPANHGPLPCHYSIILTGHTVVGESPTLATPWWTPGPRIPRGPIEADLRPLEPARDVPVAIDYFDWTSGRCLVSLVVHLPRDVEPEDTLDTHAERIAQWKDLIVQGAGQKGTSLYLETRQLRWDGGRHAWVTDRPDRYAFDPPELLGYDDGS
jgi:hypothetical protein